MPCTPPCWWTRQRPPEQHSVTGKGRRRKKLKLRASGRPAEAHAETAGCAVCRPCRPSCQVEDDKAQITAVIQQLDEKKRIALEETWKHVSQRADTGCVQCAPTPSWMCSCCPHRSVGGVCVCKPPASCAAACRECAACVSCLCRRAVLCCAVVSRSLHPAKIPQRLHAVACTQVDRDFNAIFSTLLPNTSARLNPPEGGTFLDGLEVRVAFGGVWKESLTELSGGQRSLLALSLVLALCRCGCECGARACLCRTEPLVGL